MLTGTNLPLISLTLRPEISTSEPRITTFDVLAWVVVPPVPGAGIGALTVNS
jgi:hypothetical protein